MDEIVSITGKSKSRVAKVLKRYDENLWATKAVLDNFTGDFTNREYDTLCQLAGMTTAHMVQGWAIYPGLAAASQNRGKAMDQEVEDCCGCHFTHFTHCMAYRYGDEDFSPWTSNDLTEYWIRGSHREFEESDHANIIDSDLLWGDKADCIKSA